MSGNAHGFAAAAGRVKGVEFCRVGDDRKLIVDTLYYDNLSVLAQLGLLPEDVPA